MKGKFTIEINSTEQEALESCLCQAHQGYRDTAILFLSLYAFAKSWHQDKLFYYLREMDIK